MSHRTAARPRGGQGARFRVGLAAVGAVLAAAAATPGSLAGQTLDRVEELLREDRVQDAREALVAWETEGERPGREERQRGLWYRGILTLDPAQAEATFRRLALEYPGGTWSDQALHRLGQAAALRGDLQEAERHFSVLVRDYLSSPLRLEAQDWLRRNQGALAAPVPEGAEAPAQDPRAEAPPRSDPEGTPPLPESGLRGSGDFAAQVGAFSTEDNARTVAGRLEAAGFRPRIVRLPDNPYFRVRVGRFETADEARVLIARLREAGFDAGLGTNAATERPAGG